MDNRFYSTPYVVPGPQDHDHLGNGSSSSNGLQPGIKYTIYDPSMVHQEYYGTTMHQEGPCSSSSSASTPARYAVPPGDYKYQPGPGSSICKISPDTSISDAVPPKLSISDTMTGHYTPLGNFGNDTIDLTCEDSIDRADSPTLFPESVPGAWDVVRQNSSITQGKRNLRFRTELDASDVKLVNELGQLSVDQLLDYMRNLQDHAFLLGEDESKEFARARALNVYNRDSGSEDFDESSRDQD